jgi:ATP-dependent DNA helicase RecG
MSITAFSESRELTPDELGQAPVRYPRPSALAVRLSFDHAKAEKAAAGLGLVTVGDLLEHLPRDRREARSVAQLVAGETATVVVEVRSIASRPVRRRGMRPLVEATVADGTGAMKATFFNQPWLASKYPTGTRLVLHGKFEARNRFRVQGGPPRPAPGPRASRTTRRPKGCPRRRSWPWCVPTPAPWPTCPSRCRPSCA